MNKKLYTKKIYDILPSDNIYKKNSIDKLLFLWWSTGRNSENLRLSDDGNMAFENVNIEFFEYPLFSKQEDIQKIKSARFTVDIGKKIKCPWYLGFKNGNKKTAYIRIYDSKTAMLVTLYGSILEYLNYEKTN